jgi:hypothetical protein
MDVLLMFGLPLLGVVVSAAAVFFNTRAECRRCRCPRCW